MKFSIKDFFSKCNQVCRELRIWSLLLKKSLMENINFCSVILSTVVSRVKHLITRLRLKNELMCVLKSMFSNLARLLVKTRPGSSTINLAKTWQWQSLHCEKSIQIRNFFSPYSVRMRENTDQKNLRIWILFAQC